jgi:hypothetical protein
MTFSPKFDTMRFHKLLIIGLVFWACPGPENSPDEIPVSNKQFTFHQNLNQLYFGASVDESYDAENLSKVTIYWFGTSRGNAIDTLVLWDNGTHGDILSGDLLWGLKILNDSSNISNVLGDDSGFVYLDYIAVYQTQSIAVADSFNIGNIIPRIVNISAPDTIVRPSDETVALQLVSAEVFDADGLETIKWVGFTSYHIEGDSMMNKGNYIYLYDDGSDVILYPPNFTSGDDVSGDGIYSFRIPIYGTGFTDPDFQTKAGSFTWRFSTQDASNEYSKTIEYDIIIQ